MHTTLIAAGPERTDTACDHHKPTPRALQWSAQRAPHLPERSLLLPRGRNVTACDSMPMLIDARVSVPVRGWASDSLHAPDLALEPPARRLRGRTPRRAPCPLLATRAHPARTIMCDPVPTAACRWPTWYGRPAILSCGAIPVHHAPCRCQQRELTFASLSRVWAARPGAVTAGLVAGRCFRRSF